MDDLSGLNWSSSANQPNNKPPPMNPSGANYFGSVRPTNSTPSPFPSGRNTPLSAQGSGHLAANPPAAKPAADSFSNLLSFGAGAAAKPTSKLTLLEQQQRLEAEKKKKEEEKRKQAQAQFGGGFLDTLGSGSVSRTASPGVLSPGSSTGKKASDDDDLFAAFNSDTKVDNASFYPPPPQKSPVPASTPGLDLSNPSAWSQQPGPANSGGFGDDDDPFGLNQLKPKTASPAPPPPTNDDDDFLGDLARPVEEVRRKQPTPVQPLQRPEPGKPIEASDSSSEDEGPAPRGEMAEFDRAVAQLVDYGFTPENARRGLTESGAGLNVQAAANWLLDDAHRQAKAKAQGKNPATATQRRGREDGSSYDSQRRADTRSPASGDPDLSKTAAAVGNSLFKTANSLWKTGKKQVQQAVAEFNQPEGDPNQPKWMRSAQLDRAQPERRAAEATDEALMLESGGRPPRKAGQSSQSRRPDPPRRTASRDQPHTVPGPSSGRGTPVPKWQQQGGPALPDSKTRATKLAMTDDNAVSYVSPHRRKKATPQPEAPPPQQDEPDLLFGSSQTPMPAQSLPQRPPQPSQPSRPAQPAARRPSPPTPKPAPRPARQIPPITPAAIQQSTKHRLEGTAQFKRGDYGAAHSSYSSSLAAVPPSHPLAIVILTNRALTALKTGEPKQAVEDADAALTIIGPTGGQDEQVTVVGDNGGEERRDMRDLYGKALSRKAEALEQMERWGDAHAVWSTCVKNGVGGPTAISGRQRCQNALAPKPKPKPRRAAAASAPRSKPAAATPAKNSEAVERLRKQNQAAAQEDDEKFALSEKVDARIAAWRDGKRDNLRALIGSLDQVLWEGSGWKKVGLHELVMANKVKIHYMKAIAKCHPDKLPQDASTEVRLIAATVFATLNESWDKFKAENGL
ncbi:UBA/TS-N domain-containing protein [Colletotrichum graminicola]|uniref:UBA/TS-N domain-containing protein n=1 Tax=Colletotrichum graminicola (strain M1.001 / M2 / FGSC 10212) TaxID=645133 RepID=E3QTQ0_COLGM|nr:UBA/TS-N domain-containing protein [Colletotrichum graminicola M1.001]EFQ34212.1 UBA/TS-N domain-containing protein [Colletotrichum graminicola M1.001]WDK12685.1 UBA/TS-N domain-containing protein [Colletotrichum graminicola]